MKSAASEIRPATFADCAGILRCLQDAFAPYRTDYTPGAYADTVLDSDGVKRRFEEMTVLVAVIADAIIGTIACSVSGPDEGHIRGMAVDPEFQGHGVARQLLRRAENELRERHCKRVTLNTTLPLRRAKRFYVREGYCPTGRQIEFFGMPLFEYAKAL